MVKQVRLYVHEYWACHLSILLGDETVWTVCLTFLDARLCLIHTLHQVAHHKIVVGFQFFYRFLTTAMGAKLLDCRADSPLQ